MEGRRVNAGALVAGIEPIERLASTDVAIAGLGPVGRDPEGDQPAGFGGGGSSIFSSSILASADI